MKLFYSLLVLIFSWLVITGQKLEVRIQNSEVKTIGEVIGAKITRDESKLISVIKVVDGDTISVDIDGKKETIRMIGIDTPEVVDQRKPVQCFGREASEKAKELLAGKRVFLESDPTQGDRDKYGRLLRFVFLEDSTNFGKLMISEGYAHEYTYKIPYKYMEEFKEAERESREAKRGLWADGVCSGY